jgi:hypothetical protein
MICCSEVVPVLGSPICRKILGRGPVLGGSAAGEPLLAR